MDANGTIIGLVTNANSRAVLGAASMLVMLGDRATTLPVVVFVAGAALLSAAQHRLLRSAGAQRVVPLKAMPIPDAFARVLGAGRPGRQVMFQRLGLWSHTEYNKIIMLDSDILVARNIDELASAPRDTFGPNICTYGCEKRVAGFNSGVMVIGPSMPLYEEMTAYALRRAGGEAVGRAERLPTRRGRQRMAKRSPLGELLVDQEQSFLAEFFADVHGVALEADARERDGHEWTWRSFSDRSLCGRDDAGRAPGAPAPSRPCGGRVNVLSRLYNARPGDCDRCPSSYRPKLVHFACCIKPLKHGRGGTNASRRYWEAVRAAPEAHCRRDKKAVCSACVAVAELRYLDAYGRAEALLAASRRLVNGRS